MKWEYFSKRRQISLEKFLKGAKTLEEALSLFEGRVIDPPHDKLAALFAKKSEFVVQAAAVVDAEVVPVDASENVVHAKKKKNLNYAKKQSSSE